MSPLSVGKYIKTHKKKAISSSIVIGLSIFVVLFMQVVVRNMVDGFSLSTGRLNYFSEAVSKDDKILNKVLENLNKNNSLEKVVPSLIMSSSTKNSIGMDSEFVVYKMQDKDIKFTMDKLGLTLQEGKIESSKQNSIILSEMIVKNKKLKVGDKISKDTDPYFKISGEYVLTGIMKGNTNLGFVPMDSKGLASISSKNYLFFWKDGFRKEVDSELLQNKSKNFDVTNYDIDWSDSQNFNSSFTFMCNLLIILIVIVQAIIIGFTNYSEYYQRKEEFGVEKALGFKVKDILAKVFMEILVVNLLAFAVGIALILIFIGVESFRVVVRGIPEYRLITADILKVAIFPVVTTISSVFPVAKLIRNTDTIKIIEGGH